MAYKIERNIVVPSGYVQSASGFVAPFRQVHLHSTANPSAPLDNEVAYLSRNYPNGNYTHLVGESGRVIQVAEVGQGAFDVGGDWNAETYAAIEFGERVTSQADFEKSYRAYIELARDLAKQAGIPLTLDTPDVSGIKTHNYASRTGHGSDHVDPIAFLTKWGVSYAQLKHDIENGVQQNNDNSKDELKKEIEMTDGIFKFEENFDGYFKGDHVYWSSVTGFKYLSDTDHIKVLQLFNPSIKIVSTSKGAPFSSRAAQINGTNYGKR